MRLLPFRGKEPLPVDPIENDIFEAGSLDELNKIIPPKTDAPLKAESEKK